MDGHRSRFEAMTKWTVLRDVHSPCTLWQDARTLQVRLIVMFVLVGHGMDRTYAVKRGGLTDTLAVDSYFPFEP